MDIATMQPGREKIQQQSSRAFFASLYTSLKLYEILPLPVLSTTRPLDFYREILFQIEDNFSLKQRLQGRTLLDVGCGLTPYTEDSMFQWCRREGIDFYAIDPKINNHFKFDWKDRLRSKITGSRFDPDPNSPGLEKAIRGYADDLPFVDQHLDRILSCWLLFTWLRKDTQLLEIFTEFDRVLKPGGVIHLFPAPHWSQVNKRFPKVFEFFANYQIEQSFISSHQPWNCPPAYSTRLIKPQA